MSDSDSDDVPLSMLRKASPAKAAAARPKPKLKISLKKHATVAAARKRAPQVEETSSSGEEDDSEAFIDDDEESDPDGDYEDSDDDVPLAQLKSPKKAPTPKTTATKKKAKVPVAKKKSKSKVKTVKKPKKSATPKPSKSSANRPNLPNFALDKCDKGLLVQRVLCRWWYAVTWPDPDSLPTVIPQKYDAPNGMNGIYICTSGPKTGKIKDLRDKTTAPCFKNYCRKPSEELRKILLRAIENQRKELIKHEGADTDTEKELRVIEKWALKLNAAKCDREAERALKAAGIKL